MADPTENASPEDHGGSVLAQVGRTAVVFRQLEEGRRRLVARVAQMPPEGQRWSIPGRGRGGDSWTPLQVLDHVARVEAFTVLGVRQGLGDGPAKGPSLRHRAGRLLVRAVFSLRLRVGTPDTRVDPAPADSLTLGQVERDWYEAREALRQALSEVEDPRRALVRHPVAGPLNVLETLEFLGRHQRHHMHQVDRIRKHPSFPWAVR
ncbi:MAG: DinB family protein [Gemmatimonadales bacterium]|nr:MAG: DinB family protein [Gemmatimonadales bacterium]